MIFNVQSGTAGGEADPSLFIHGTQRVLMRIYVHGRQTAEKKTDDTFLLSFRRNQAISRHGVAEIPPEIVKPRKSLSLRTYIFLCIALK